MPEPRVADIAGALNEGCQCITLDPAVLHRALLQEAGGAGLDALVASHPHLFSHSAVFVARDMAERMRQVVAAVDRIVALPRYRERVLASANPHARVETKTRGVFLGFDFHLSEDGPKLIEINTNAGGGLLNVLLRQAQRACCEPVAQAFHVHAAAGDEFFEMFRAEWQLARAGAPLRSVAIVDDDPQSQYLYPEFVVFRELCRARGLEARICDARELELREGRLCHDGVPLDLIYNRTTDFTLAQLEHAALAQAYREDLAVVTPHPRAYELYADKRRLALLADPAALRELAAAEADISLLEACIPRTRVVAPELRDELWRERKRLFFKPQTGYGGKAAYRGDGISKRVFEQVLVNPYIAQELVVPSLRKLTVGDETRELKLDIRNFAYAGRVQLVCARLYGGQTTNFRTQGGGFAPVYEV